MKSRSMANKKTVDVDKEDDESVGDSNEVETLPDSEASQVVNEVLEGEVTEILEEDDALAVEEVMEDEESEQIFQTTINDDDDDTVVPEEKTAPKKENYPRPLLRQIKQEVIEEIISNEKNARPAKKVHVVSPMASKKKKMRREKLLGPNSDQSETDPPDTIDVTCGHLRGVLHKELFYCPGIHRACVELEDGTFVTPKKFMFMGEKARLKDWKNAIRWNGHQLRKHIEAGTLHFYKHDELCTGRCMARAPFAGKDQYPTPRVYKKDKFEFETLGFTAEEEDGTESIPENLKYMTTVEENGCMKIQSVSGGDHSMWDNDEGQGQPQIDDEPPDIKPDVKELQIQMMKSMQSNIEPTRSMPKTQSVTLTNHLPSVIQTAKYQTATLGPVKQNSPSLLPPSIMNAVMPPVSANDSTEEEDRLLWQGIVELGLVDEFFREIKASLDLLKNTMVKRLVPIEDSNRISVIVRQLGLMQKLKFKLEAHRTDMDRQRRRLDREMMDLQRRVKEYEQKKKLLEKKSECFDQILEIPTMKNNSAVPLMVYPNQGQPSTSVAGALSSPGSSFPKNLGSIAKAGTNGSGSTLASNGRIASGPGGSRILVFPKQNTEFFSSPEGGLKITLKRKLEMLNESAAQTNLESSHLKNLLTSVLPANPKRNQTEENSVENTSVDAEIATEDADINPENENLLTLEEVSNEEQSLTQEELNSSHEDLSSVHSGGGDQQSDDNSLKRSKRRRSAKIYDDYIK